MVPDSNSTRPSYALTTRVHAAWAYGRIFNELSHRLQIAWLTLDVQYGAQVKWLWVELGRAVRGIVADEPLRIKLEDRIAVGHANWNRQFGREWHAQLLNDSNHHLNDHPERYSEFSTAEIITQQCETLLYSVSESLSLIETKVESKLSRKMLEITRLARWADRLLHPIPAYQYMTIWQEAPPQEGSNPWETASPVKNGPNWLLPALPLLPQDVWKDDEQVYQQLELRVHQLNVECQITRDREHALIAIEQALLANATCVSAEAKEGKVIAEEVSLSRETASPSYPHYLGLFVDLATKELCLKGSEKRVPIPRPLTVNLLKRFIESRGVYISKETFAEEWEKLGGRGEREKIGSEITAVRKCCLQLGFGIETVKSYGWRIVMEQSSSALPSGDGIATT